MARLKPTVTKISGKLDDTEYIHSVHGSFTKKARKKTSKRQDKTMKTHSQHTGSVNLVAGDIARMLDHYTPYIHRTDLYSRLLSPFKKVPTRNRYLMLQSLKDFDLNIWHTLEPLGRYTLNLFPDEEKIKIRLEVIDHPHIYMWEKYDSNCHQYEFYLICWTNEGETTWLKTRTKWVPRIKGVYPTHTLKLDLPPGTAQWLMMMRHVAGENNIALENVRAEGMGIVGCGTLLPEDEVAFAQLMAVKNAVSTGSGRKEEEDWEEVGPDEE